MDQYRQLAEKVTDKDHLSRIYHNIGNGHFAKKEYDKSIEAYKSALKNNPFDDETRYNLIVAQKMLQQQNQDKQNQQQQQKDQQKDQKKEEEKKEEQKQDQQQQQQQQPQQQNMSEKDAERLLNAIQQDENKLQEKMKKANAAQKNPVEKNW